MRILVVAPWVPSRRRPRSFGLLEELATVHDVCVVAATWSEADREDLARLRVQETRSVELATWKGALRSGAGLLGRRSLQQAYLDDPRLRSAIREEWERFAPDLTYFNVLRTAHLAREVPQPRVIDLDEFRSSYYDQLAVTSRSPVWRQLGRIEGARMRRAEDQVVDDFPVILVSSPSDLHRDADRVRLVRSPHHMPAPDAVGASTEAGDRPRIVFVGRLSYRANVEAVHWFVDEVLPEVVRRHPDVVLDVVGAEPHRSLARLAGPNVSIVGGVPDVAPYYARATVSIVPVFLATGVQMKLIESLSLGVATVTTTTVAELAGIDGGGPCLVADDPEGWAAAVSSLIGQPDRRRAVGAAGQRWAEAHYDRRAIADSLHAALAGVVSGPPVVDALEGGG